MPARPVTSATIHPSLYCDDAAAAIDFLERAFGFRRRLVVPGPVGKVMHSELTFGDGVVMLGSSRPERGCLSPRRLGGTCQRLSVFIEDPDAHCARARAAGAEIVQGLRDEEYGARGYMTRDPEGHLGGSGRTGPGRTGPGPDPVSAALGRLPAPRPSQRSSPSP